MREGAWLCARCLPLLLMHAIDRAEANEGGGVALLSLSPSSADADASSSGPFHSLFEPGWHNTITIAIHSIQPVPSLV